jgi:protein SCO1/2
MMMLQADERRPAETSTQSSAQSFGLRRLRARLVVFAVTLAIVIAFFVYRQAAAPAEALPVLMQIDPFSLVDQHGKKVELADLGAKVWVADFIFTGCQSACPMLSSRMHSLQTFIEERERKLGQALPVLLVSFSVDPEVDTPAKLTEYAARYGADDRRWLFLTGSLAEMNRAVTGSMKIPFQKGGADTSAFDVMHGEHLVLVDGRGRIRGYFDADDEGMTRLKLAVESLASGPKGAT